MVMEGSGWGEGEQDGRLLTVRQWLGLSLSKFPLVGPSFDGKQGEGTLGGGPMCILQFLLKVGCANGALRIIKTHKVSLNYR